MKIFVLTREINRYDQDGEYFVEVYVSKPSYQQLIEIGVPRNRIRHVMNGGGRVGTEDQWFFLREKEV